MQRSWVVPTKPTCRPVAVGKLDLVMRTFSGRMIMLTINHSASARWCSNCRIEHNCLIAVVDFGQWQEATEELQGSGCSKMLSSGNREFTNGNN